MKRLFRIFVLSKSEQRVVLIVIIGLIGAGLRWRDMNVAFISLGFSRHPRRKQKRLRVLRKPRTIDRLSSRLTREFVRSRQRPD